MTIDSIQSLETWGTKILDAVERQERILTESLSLNRGHPLFSQQASPSPVDEVDTESISRNDAPTTPITGSDMILNWPIFPKDKPVSTFPMVAYSEKPDAFQTGIVFEIPRGSESDTNSTHHSSTKFRSSKASRITRDLYDQNLDQKPDC